MLQRSAYTPLLVSVVVLLGLYCSPVLSWGGKTHYKITSDAYHIMPKAFRVFLGETGTGRNTKKPAIKPLMEACVEPDRKLKDFQNHVYHIHGFKMGNGPFRVDKLVEEVVEDIKNKASRKTIIQKLGWIAHYVGDLAQPLHTGVATWKGIEEKTYHAKCERDTDKHIYTYGVHFNGAQQIKRISARMVYESLWANQYYDAIQAAYVTGKGYEDAKPIITKCYSKAVNNVVDIWYTVWARTGGKIRPKIDGRPKYYPPHLKKGSSSASLPHTALKDASGF